MGIIKSNEIVMVDNSTVCIRQYNRCDKCKHSKRCDTCISTDQERPIVVINRNPTLSYDQGDIIYGTFTDGEELDNPPMMILYSKDKLSFVLTPFKYSKDPEHKAMQGILYWCYQRVQEESDNGKSIFMSIVKSCESKDFTTLEKIVRSLVDGYRLVSKKKHDINVALCCIPATLVAISKRVWVTWTRKITQGVLGCKSIPLHTPTSLFEKVISGDINPFSISSLEYAKCNRLNTIVEAYGSSCYTKDPTTQYLYSIMKDVNSYCESGGHSHILTSDLRSIIKKYLPKIIKDVEKEFNRSGDTDDQPYRNPDGIIFYLKIFFDLKVENDMIYTPYLYDIHTKCYNAIDLRVNQPLKNGNFFNTETYKNITEDLSEEQTEALRIALSEKISIITGGAGTGKTKTIAAIVKSLASLGMKVQLTSKTGKAVARMKEMLEDLKGDLPDPRTMDKIIHSSDSSSWDYLIIDEASMIDGLTFADFVYRNQGGYPILFVGDNNQLEPIGIGSIFFQMYDSCSVKVTKFTKNYRIKDDGALKDNVLSIVTSNPIIKEGEDFRILDTDNTEESYKLLYSMINKLKSEGMKSEDLHILSIYKEPIDNLNIIFLKAFFDKLPAPFVLGQRVMMKDNNYENGLFNGDVGIVQSVCDDYVDVDFGWVSIKRFHSERSAKFFKSKTNLLLMKHIEHAHATTVHKAQGSEYNSVILFLQHKGSSSSLFLTYKLLYTALSRARDVVYVIGDTEVIKISNDSGSKIRYDSLGSKLKEKYAMGCRATDIIEDTLEIDEEAAFGDFDFE